MNRHWMLASALTILLAATQAAWTQTSAYDQLDNKHLSEVLTSLGMTELLEELANDPAMAGTTAGRAMRVESLVSAAQSAESIEQRDAMLLEAARLLQGIVQETMVRPGENLSQVASRAIEHLQYRVRFADLAFVTRVEPYVYRLRYLHGGPSDRAVVEERTRGATAFLFSAANFVEQLSSALRDTRNEQWRQNPLQVARLFRTLTDVEAQLQYRWAWIALYRGLALDADDATQAIERRDLLQQAVTRAGNFLADANAVDVHQSCLLITGIAQRALGQGRPAEAALSRLTADSVEASLRLEALFELACLAIEQDQGSPAAAIDRYVQAARRLAGGQPGETIRIDITRALLRSYMHLAQADRARRADRADEAARLDAQAADALLEFLRAHDDVAVQEEFLYMLATRYRERTDYQQLSPLVLLGLGLRALYEAGDQALAEKLQMMVLDRDDPVSRELAPLALWQLGLARMEMQNPVGAAEAFVRLSEQYGSHPRGFDGAVNAIVALNAAMDSDPSHRPRLIRALELMVSAEKWPARQADASRWNFDLTWQYRVMARQRQQAEPAPQRDADVVAWINKAAAAAEKVPADHPGALEAAFWRLELLAELPQYLHADQADRVAEYKRLDLVNQLDAFAARAVAAAEQARRQADTADAAATMRVWASRAEFQAARVLYESDQRQAARTRLEALPGKYPDTPVRIEAVEYDIRMLIEEGRENPAQIDAAIRKADAFRAEHPEQAEQTIRLIVQQIRQRIHESDGAAGAADGYRLAYARFAEDLFTRVAAQPLAERYSMTQMYAESRLELARARSRQNAAAGRELFNQALGLFTQTYDFHEAQRNQRVGGAQEALRQHAQKVRAATDPADVPALVETFMGELAKRNIRAAGFPPARLVREADELFRDAQDAASQAQEAMAAALTDQQRAELKPAAERARTRVGEMMRLVVRRLVEGYDRLGVLDGASQPVDADNLLGLARSHQGLGDFRQAAQFYNRVIDGLDRHSQSGLYWRLQLESSRCILQGFGDQPEVMAQLVGKIAMLKNLDATEGTQLGGLLGEFNAVEAEARRRSSR